MKENLSSCKGVSFFIWEDLTLFLKFYLILYLAYNHQPLSIFFLHALQSLQLIHDNTDFTFLLIYCKHIQQNQSSNPYSFFHQSK